MAMGRYAGYQPARTGFRGRPKKFRTMSKNVPKSVKNYVKNALNTNIETIDARYSTSARQVDTTGNVYATTMPTDGSGGEKVRMKSISFRYQIAMADTGVQQINRFILLKTKGDLAPTIANVFNSAHPLSYLNDSFNEHFVKLADKTVMMGAADTYESRKLLLLNKKLDYTYSDTTNVGEIYLVSVGSVVAGVTSTNISGYYMVKYSDA